MARKKVFVVGSGGREHAIAWKIAQSPNVKKIFCAPGNPGIAEVAECVDIDANNIRGLFNFAIKQKIAEKAKAALLARAIHAGQA